MSTSLFYVRAAAVWQWLLGGGALPSAVSLVRSQRVVWRAAAVIALFIFVQRTVAVGFVPDRVLL